MSIQFRLRALERDTFEPLLELDDAALAEQGGRWCVADAKPSYPCRVSLEDAEVGERLILVPFVHHDVDSPYRSSGPIFVRQAAESRKLEAGEIPASLQCRELSLRAYDAEAMMVGGVTVAPGGLGEAVEVAFSDPKVAYLHVHNAGPGCFACEVVRLDGPGG